MHPQGKVLVRYHWYKGKKAVVPVRLVEQDGSHATVEKERQEADEISVCFIQGSTGESIALARAKGNLQ